MILDKLLEKKDLVVYLKLRIKECQKHMREIKKFPYRERGLIKKSFEGRVKELDLLIKNINNIKDEGKNLWRNQNDD
jgi:hypothetical protein